jgi:DNA-binding transcriptional regulator of glucitol operon
MVRRLLTPKWVLLHVLCLIAFLVCLRLGWWQWDKAKSHSGTMQNFGYALNWPLFAAFTVVLWWRAVRDVLHPKPADETAVEQPSETPRLRVSADPDIPAVQVAAPPVLPTEEEDPEVAAYNRYLASLYARDEARERQRQARRTAGARGGNA